MRTHVRALLLALLALLSAPALHAAERAVWVWEDASTGWLDDPAYAGDAIAFLRGRGISTVYLYVEPYPASNRLANDPAAYRVLLSRLRANGIRPHALLGSGHLNSDAYTAAQRRAIAEAQFQGVLDYNAGALPAERFEGVSLDIEPHLLKAWSNKQATLLVQFLDLGRSLMDMKRRSGQSALQVGPAIPFWYDGLRVKWNRRTQYMHEHVLDVFDHAVLMDYRDHADGSDGIIAHARAEIDAAALRGKRVVIGVETADNEIAKVTFFDNTDAQLELALAQTASAYAGHAGFGGFAVHHFESYVEWLAAQ